MPNEAKTPGESWAAWLREQFDSHDTIRRAIDLSRASGTKENGRPVIDQPRVTSWMKGERPSYDLAVVAALAFGRPMGEALAAAGYHPDPSAVAGSVAKLPDVKAGVQRDSLALNFKLKPGLKAKDREQARRLTENMARQALRDLGYLDEGDE